MTSRRYMEGVGKDLNTETKEMDSKISFWHVLFPRCSYRVWKQKIDARILYNIVDFLFCMSFRALQRGSKGLWDCLDKTNSVNQLLQYHYYYTFTHACFYVSVLDFQKTQNKRSKNNSRSESSIILLFPQR